MTSKLVEHLNEALSTENASVDRITSRIDQTSMSYQFLLSENPIAQMD
ncbi:MAG: hypothetical protein M3M84_05465 [Thermoproteota archaeon]|nr:hypothetical protein [Thermoproteota archaeon]